jgi:uncharacterized delta-60 repeat protein
MRRWISCTAFLAICAAAGIAGCGVIATFDRSRIAEDGGSDAAPSDAAVETSTAVGPGCFPGAVDPTFGDGGTVVIDGVTPAEVAHQPDGRILVVGSNASGMVLARLDPSGALDTPFGDAGVVVTPSEVGRAILVQPDGRILALGAKGTFARYLANGALDPSFGEGGVAPLDEPGASSFALQQDGKILVLALPPNFRQPVLERFVSDGTRDLAFADGGLSVGGCVEGMIHPVVAVTKSGLILVALEGFCPDEVAHLFSIGPDGTRYGGASLFSPGFQQLKIAPDERAAIAIGNVVQYFNPAILSAPDSVSASATSFVTEDVVFDSLGRTVVVGAGGVSFARLFADGGADPSFGDGGAVVTPSNCATRVRASLDGCQLVVTGCAPTITRYTLCCDALDAGAPRADGGATAFATSLGAVCDQTDTSVSIGNCAPPLICEPSVQTPNAPPSPNRCTITCNANADCADAGALTGKCILEKMGEYTTPAYCIPK